MRKIMPPKQAASGIFSIIRMSPTAAQQAPKESGLAAQRKKENRMEEVFLMFII